MVCIGVDNFDTGTVNCPDAYACTLTCGGGNDACGDANLWVQVIDAGYGRSLGSFTAYDATTTWVPDREGDPAQVSGTTRFH